MDPDWRWHSGGSPEAARADHGHEPLERMVRILVRSVIVSLVCVVIQAACIVLIVATLLLRP